LPKFRRYNSSNYSISIKPVGFRRGWPFHIFPYPYGSDVEFDVVIKNNVNKAIPYEWRLSRWDGQRGYYESKDNYGELCPNEKHKVIYVGNLFKPGQYSLQMRWGMDIASKGSWELMAAFTIIDRDILALNWALALIGVIIGGIVGAAITFILTRWF
jgi:hypothetical protein